MKEQGMAWTPEVWVSNLNANERHYVERLEEEKKRRVYYQGIVYAVCNELGQHVVCGTIEEPSTEAQGGVAALRAEVERLTKRVAEDRDTIYGQDLAISAYEKAGAAQDALEKERDSLRARVAALKEMLELVVVLMPETEPEDPESDNHGDTRDYGYDIAHFHYGSIAKAALKGIRVFRDGNAWCATGPGFVDLAVSPAGFGDTIAESIAALLAPSEERAQNALIYLALKDQPPLAPEVERGLAGSASASEPIHEAFEDGFKWLDECLEGKEESDAT